MRLLSLSDLQSVKGILYSRPHVYRLVKDGKFPPPVKLGAGDRGRIAFLESEIDAWLSEKIAGRSRAA